MGSRAGDINYGADADDESNAINIKDIRLAIKLACLMRNQEYPNFYA